MCSGSGCSKSRFVLQLSRDKLHCLKSSRWLVVCRTQTFVFSSNACLVKLRRLTADDIQILRVVVTANFYADISIRNVQI